MVVSNKMLIFTVNQITPVKMQNLKHKVELLNVHNLINAKVIAQGYRTNGIKLFYLTLRDCIKTSTEKPN